MPKEKLPARKRKPAPKKPEPKLPKEVYVYFVEAYRGYGYRNQSKRTEMRTVSSLEKVPPGKRVGIYKLSKTGSVEKTVNVSLSVSDD